MKNTFLCLLVYGLLASSCKNNSSSKNSEDNQNSNKNIKIEISEEGLFLNLKKVSNSISYDTIKSIIGIPSKEIIQTTAEIDKFKQKYNLAPNNIYTYDNYGIIVYQNIDNLEVESISIDFKKLDYPFSPKNPFTGILSLSGVNIENNTSLLDLKKIKGLEISKPIRLLTPAKFNNYKLNLGFDTHSGNNELQMLSIQINHNIEQTPNIIDNLKLSLPCNLELVFNQNSTKSYTCQTILNDIPVSYRVTIQDFTDTFQKMDNKSKSSFTETYLDKIKNDVSTKSKNVKSLKFKSQLALQYDDIINMEDMTLQSRTFVFIYKGKSISFLFVSSISGFDSRFENFLNNITLI